jgi:hypothetical protein
MNGNDDDDKGTVSDEIRHMKSFTNSVNKSNTTGVKTMPANRNLDNHLVFPVQQGLERY